MQKISFSTLLMLRYDSHRDQILKGGTGVKDDGCREEEINLWPYFSKYLDSFLFPVFSEILIYRSCYSGYGDDKDSFYKVYSTVFKAISDEEPPNLNIGTKLFSKQKIILISAFLIFSVPTFWKCRLRMARYFCILQFLAELCDSKDFFVGRSP